MTHGLEVRPAARRALAQTLPGPVAAAVVGLLRALPENPGRLGKPLRAPFEGLHCARRGTYRVVYRIDEEAMMVRVLGVRRADAYRP